jgi:hypothetical protein
MKPQSLFEALAKVAGEHERAADDHLLVIPVLTDELESRRDLLREIAEFLGGALLDLSRDDYDSAIDAYDDPVLRGAVAGTLQFYRPGIGHSKVTLSYTNGQLDATLITQGEPAASPSRAESRLLSIVRSLFDIRLVDDELAILSYEEDIFDQPTQSALLSMLTGLARQSGLRLGSVRTLVPLIRSGGLNPERHCQLYRGVRFSLTEDTLIERNPPRHVTDVVRKVTADRPTPLVLVLGAGFSVSSGMPIGNGVRNSAIQRICELADIAGRSDRDLATELFRYASDRDFLTPLEREGGEENFSSGATLEQALRIERQAFDRPIPETLEQLQRRHNERLSGPPQMLGSAVYDLREIVRQGHRLILITVNFDELVEHENAEHLDIAVDDTDFERLTPLLAEMQRGASHPENLAPLLKLHGTINRPESCIATDEETRSGISPAKERALHALVDEAPDGQLQWVYVGASMRDIDLNAILASNPFNEKLSEYWVAPWLEPSVCHFVYSKGRWWVPGQSLLDRVVTETADSFMRILAKKWNGPET